MLEPIPVPIVDTHIHIWDVTTADSATRYPWLTPDKPVLNRTFGLADVEPDLRRTGVEAAVLVQASDSLSETEMLLDAAEHAARPTVAVGWLPLDDPPETAAQLRRFASRRRLVGVRHLIHLDPDPYWLLRATVGASLDLLAEADMTFDAVAETVQLLELVPHLARSHPQLTIVLDHLGKPAIGRGEWSPWAELISAIAAEPNVVAKLSGLATVSDGVVTAERWQPYVDHALAQFGPDRLMFGSDWPYTLMAADYGIVWETTADVLSGLDDHARAEVLAHTASRVYRVPLAADHVAAHSGEEGHK
jgi:L-fucono-1,5-lactonase